MCVCVNIFYISIFPWTLLSAHSGSTWPVSSLRYWKPVHLIQLTTNNNSRAIWSFEATFFFTTFNFNQTCIAMDMKRELFEIGNKLYSDFHYDKRKWKASFWYLSRSSEYPCTWISRLFSLHLFVTPLFLFHSLLYLQNLSSFFQSHSQRGSSDSRSSEELPTHGGYRGLRRSSSGSEEGVQELFEVGVHPQLCPPSLEQQSPAHCTGTRGPMRVVQHLSFRDILWDTWFWNLTKWK